MEMTLPNTVMSLLHYITLSILIVYFTVGPGGLVFESGFGSTRLSKTLVPQTILGTST